MPWHIMQKSYNIWEELSYHCLFFLVKALSLLPFKLLYAISDCLYPFVYHVFRYRRRIARRNLVESFPDKPLEEIIRMERKFYHFFLDTALESVKLLSISDEEIGRRIQFEGLDIANKHLSEGRSVSVLLGHYGNWEWLSTASLHTPKEAKVALIYHSLRNKPMDRLMRRIRERAGSVCIDMHQTVRFMAERKADGKPCMIGFIADQSPKRRESKHFLKFLNHNAPVLTGTEKATKHFGYEAMFLGVERLRRGHYKYTLTPLCDNPGSLPDHELTRLYFQRLEEEIRATPELYLWTHNRFKYADTSEH